MSTTTHILLADDSPLDIELALAALQEIDRPVAVTVVPDGATALDFLRVRGPYAGRRPVTPALVILDVFMPRIHGLEVLRQLRTDPQFHHLPVIMTTGVSDPSDVFAIYESAHTSFLLKPFTAATLLATSFRVGGPLGADAPAEESPAFFNPTRL